MELLLYDQSSPVADSSVAETALISYIDQAYLPVREAVIFGSQSSYNYSLERIIRQFNRNNREYYVELKEYDDGQLEENDEMFYYMAEHMKCESNIYYSPISDIISEELPAFFSGDKTAKEAAQIIQSRVQLYLDER